MLERLAQLALVRLGEPAAGVERLGEDPLELRGSAGDQRLGGPQAIRRLERGDRRLELGLGELPAWHRPEDMGCSDSAEGIAR